MTVTIQKWGNSLAMRIPKALAQSAGLDQGAKVDVAVEDGKIILHALQVPSLTELLKQVKPSNRPTLEDWGSPVGKEVW